MFVKYKFGEKKMEEDKQKLSDLRPAFNSDNTQIIECGHPGVIYVKNNFDSQPV